MSSDPVLGEIVTKDPLSDATRRERKLLLAMSTIAVLMARTGWVPTKISALGIDFDHADQQTIRWLFAGITLYSLVAFVIYAAADDVAYRRALFDAAIRNTRERTRDQRAGDNEIARVEGAFAAEAAKVGRATVRMRLIRKLFDVWLPIAYGVVGVVLLSWSALQHHSASGP